MELLGLEAALLKWHDEHDFAHRRKALGERFEGASKRGDGGPLRTVLTEDSEVHAPERLMGRVTPLEGRIELEASGPDPFGVRDRGDPAHDDAVRPEEGVHVGSGGDRRLDLAGGERQQEERRREEREAPLAAGHATSALRRS